ncbi:MAG: hypothetical protein ABWY29_07675 [Blastococcus sp.]
MLLSEVRAKVGGAAGLGICARAAEQPTGARALGGVERADVTVTEHRVRLPGGRDDALVD